MASDHSLLRANSSHGDFSNLMATLSTKKHTNKLLPSGATPSPKVDFVKRWKENFWVCNHREKRLDYFANDQALVRKGCILARDIVSVNSRDNKTSKFFELVVSCRQEKQGRDFKFRSAAERDQWHSAIVEMMALTKSVDQVSSLVSLVRQRLEEGMREIGGGEVVLEANVASIVEIPQEMQGSYVEAVDKGIRFVRKLSGQLRRTGLGLNALRKVSMIINVGIDAGNSLSKSSSAADSTPYDPQAKTLSLFIFVSKDPLGQVDVSHIDEKAALNLLSSSVYRDPRYEAWLRDPLITVEKNKIAQLLGIPDFKVQLSWALTGGHDETQVSNYFTTFVKSAVILKHVFQIFQQLIAFAASQAGEAASAESGGAAAASAFGSNEPAATGPLGSSTSRQTSEAAMTNISLTTPHGSTFNGSQTVNFSESQPSTPARPKSTMAADGLVVSPLDCIRRCVTGINISIHSSHLNENLPPEISLIHGMWTDSYYHPAISVTSNIRRKETTTTSSTTFGGATGSSGSGSYHLIDDTLQQTLLPIFKHNDSYSSLCHQTLEIIRYGKIAAACDEAEQTLTNAVGVDEGVEVDWESLTSVLSGIHCPFDEEKIPLLIRNVIQPYRERMSHLVAMLRSFDLFTTFITCVSGCKLGFQGNDEVEIAQPTVYMGVFYDTMILAPPNFSENSVARFAETKPILLNYPRGLGVIFDSAYLGSWFRGYFAHPANLVAYPKKINTGDGMDGESDDSDNEGGLLENYREAVALQRRDETKVLRREDVVNLVYEEQGDIIEYKVSAEAIQRGLESAEGVFPDFNLRLHDLRRILVHALARLRMLFAEQAAKLVGPVTSYEEVKAVLIEYCDYHDSEEMVNTALNKKLFPGPFQAAANVVLNVVLPNELVHAVKSRRDILLVGMGNTGKTLITNLLGGRPVTSAPHATVGRTETLVAYREWLFSFNEIGGRPDFRSNWTHYLNLCPDLHGIVFVIDSAYRSELRDAEHFYSEVLGHKKLKGLPVLVLANNCAADRAVDPKPLEELFGIESRNSAGQHDNAFLSTCEVVLPEHTSRHIDAGLAAGMDWLCTAIGARCGEQDLPPVPKTVETASPTGGRLPASKSKSSESLDH